MVFDLNRSAGFDEDDNAKSQNRSHSVKFDSSSEDGENYVNTSEECVGSGDAAKLALEIERRLEVGSVVEDIDQVYMLYSSIGIPISSAYKFMVKESGGRQNVGFIRKDAYAHMNRTKLETKVANGDANALYQFFIDKDSRCAIAYKSFGNVFSVDTIYKTNKYNLVCAPFVSINHHLQNMMFGLGFLSDETTKSFEWLFGAFLESMNGKEPENAPSHFGSLNGNREFKSMWHRCMNGCETEEEFENLWSEVTNKVLKDLGKRSNSMYEFVLNFLEVQTDWLARESAEDALCCGMPGQFMPGNQLLSHAAGILTRNVFKLFEFEATQSMNINVIHPPADFVANELIFYTKGVLCRHIFKVYYFLNVASVREQYLLRRWRGDAKQRCADATSGRACGNVNVPDHVFVNQIMRLIYDMVHDNTGSADSRAAIHDYIFKMQSELLKRKDGSMDMGKNDYGSGGQETISHLMNPNVVRTHGNDGKPKRQKWNNTNRKGNKMTSKLGRIPSLPAGTVMNDKQESSWHCHGKQNSSTAVHSARMESSFSYAGCSGIGTQRSVHEVADSVLETIHARVRLLEENVIRKMAFEFWEGTWIHGNNENNKRVMGIVRLDVKQDLGIDIPISTYRAKLAQLDERFKNFSKLIVRDDVVYSELYNTVQASAETWWDIEETNPYLLVYMQHGEPCWHYLKDLFVEFIEISETTAKSEARGMNARSTSGSRSNTSTGRRNKVLREVIQISNSTSDEVQFPRALYVSSDSTSNVKHQSSDSRCESGVVD
ncbi:hypothetical protein C2S52_021928 [Perilla frutescens var. hirtella]|nr:hypothetical protein C2S52_021928 [Perilla frutescens var. hirtella]